MNDFGKLSDRDLRNKVAEITAMLIEDYALYGVSEASVAAVAALNGAFGSGIQGATRAASYAKSATSAKNAQRQQVLDAIRQLTRQVYADPDVDDALLNKAGYSPRQVYGTKTSPKEVTVLTANAHSNGSVTLKWNRGGNSRSALFTVWAKGVTGPWVNVGATTKLKITLEDFTPGTFKQFYVTATVNNQTSAASTYAAIYGGWEAKGNSAAA